MIIWRYGHETASIAGLNLGPGLKLEALRTLRSHTDRLTESSNASLLLYICGEFFPPSPTFTHPRKSRLPYFPVRLFLRPDYSILNLNRPPFVYNSYQFSVHTLSVKMADSSKTPTSTGERPPSVLAEAAKSITFSNVERQQSLSNFYPQFSFGPKSKRDMPDPTKASSALEQSRTSSLAEVGRSTTIPTSSSSTTKQPSTPRFSFGRIIQRRD